jgi:DNA-binding transcriptional LysR family regulator
MSVPNRDLTISAVLAGSGIGIVDLIVTADHLVSGAITPIGSAATTGWQYHLVLPQRRRPGAAVRQFQDWLVAEMADTQQQLAARGVA